MKKIINALPLVVFASLIIVLFSFLSDRDDQLETALIDSSFPEFKLGSLSDESRILTKQDIIKLPALINVWATWCIACRVEHPFLMELSKLRNLKLVGVNFKDKKNNALNFLNNLGNPFYYLAKDEQGKQSISFGIYGIPESILINKELIIIKKFIGPLNTKDLEEIKKTINSL